MTFHQTWLPATRLVSSKVGSLRFTVLKRRQEI